jgi:type II secretory ATPase GspE/PulE/Tfp pilus assembly ATPase PilB-like protein
MSEQAPPQDTAATPAAGRGAQAIISPEDFTLEGLDAPEIWIRISTAAVREQASDIHLTYQKDGLHVALRLDGQLVEQGVLPPDHGNRLTNHVKVQAALDVSESRRPQEGHILTAIDGREVDIRVGLLPTNHGEDLALRILDRDTALLSIEELGLLEPQMPQLESLLAAPSGLILVTGSTGAGKTTTLYALLRKLASGSRKIVTIENPIEYDLPGVTQSEVHYRIGLDYGTLLRGVLRQDPNVMMIGEIRDAETAAALVRAANSGRLVLATSHAAHVAAAVESLISLGANPHFVGRAFRGAIAQTLVRRVCPKCSEPLSETRDESLLSEVQHLMPEGREPTLALGRGCAHCRHTGYRGRMGIFEVLVANEEVRNKIAAGAMARELYDTVREQGVITLEDAGKLAAALGQTTLEELFAHVTELWKSELNQSSAAPAQQPTSG